LFSDKQSTERSKAAKSLGKINNLPAAFISPLQTSIHKDKHEMTAKRLRRDQTWCVMQEITT